MQKCPCCGEEIRFIVSRGVAVACEIKEFEFITESGRRVSGFRPHCCGGGKNAEKKREADGCSA